MGSGLEPEVSRNISACGAEGARNGAFQRVIVLFPNVYQLMANGFKTSTPSVLESTTLRVTTVKPCTLAVAAIIASSYSDSDFRCMNFAPFLNAAASIV